MPLQTYAGFFGPPQQRIEVKPMTNAFLRGHQMGQNEQRTNEFQARGEAERQRQTREWKEEDRKRTRDAMSALFRSVDDTSDEAFLRTITPVLGEAGKTLYRMYGEDATEGIQGLATLANMIKKGQVSEARSLVGTYKKTLEGPAEIKEPQYTDQKRGIGPDGKPVFFRVNKQTGEPQIISGVIPEPKAGERLIVGKDGTITLERGGAVGSSGISDEVTKRKITDKLVDRAESLSRLNEISQMYEPKYQEFWPQMKQKWSAAKEKYLGADLSPNEKAELKKYSAYCRTVIENLNLYIKMITGAQMSEAEASRLKKAMPNTEDSPTEFEGKLEDATRQGRLAVARYQYLLKEGFTKATIERLMETDKESGIAEIDSVMPLNKFKGIMKTRMNELQTQNPDITKEELKERLATEFGIGG